MPPLDLTQAEAMAQMGRVAHPVRADEFWTDINGEIQSVEAPGLTSAAESAIDKVERARRKE